MEHSYRRITYRIIVLLAVGLSLSSPVMAFVSPFTEVTAITDSLTGVSASSAAWGDYDNDGDLDILLAGSNVAIYRNDAGTFVDIEAGLASAYGGSVAWGDYDNDGDLDILLTGYDGSAYTSIVYRNDAGSFTDISAGLQGRTYSSAAWGDYDNDGDLDILLLGSGSGTVYRNDDGIFTGTDAFFSSYTHGKGAAAWGDYDNDGDLDVLVTDQYPNSFIYENDGGSFTEAVPLPGVYDAEVAWGDYNNDGDLDLLFTGYTGSTRYTVLYENNEGVFSGHYVGSTGLTDVEDASVAWGDYDNDGDLDILLSGWTGSSTFARVYQNNGDDTFTDIVAGLSAVSSGSAVWGDYDNDEDLDILLSGFNGATYISKVYENNSLVANTAPTAPTGLQSSVIQDTVTLSWDIATDTEPDAGGLSYNLRVGTTAGGDELMPTHADGITGYRLIPALGNVQANLRWFLYDLPDGTIYWSVQSIDLAFAGSAFAAEDSFLIAVPPATPQSLEVGTDYYTIGSVPLIWNQNTEGDFLRYRIYMDTSPVPTAVIDSTNAIGDTTVSISGLSPGTTYYFRITAVDEGLRESGFSNEVNVTPADNSLMTDSLALVDLYISTDSTNWTTKWDLNVPLSGWSGVSLSLGRVYRLSLSDNNLSGAIPASIGDLVNLDRLYLNDNDLTAVPGELDSLSLLAYLYLYNNQLVDLPDLSPLSSTLTSLRVYGNKLTFEDIEPNIGISGFSYSPQDSVGAEKDTTVEAGTSLALLVSVGGTANQYQWMKDGYYISGATDDTLTLDPVSESDSGSYVCRIRNTIATRLTLYSRPIHVVVTPTVSVSVQDALPNEFALRQNYPNPFNPTSTIQYDLPKAANVSLVVYDILGRETVKLVDQEMQPGYNNAVWDARDHAGRAMPSGIYIARLVTQEYTKVIKMVLLK